jgi:hypothetical protein
VRDLYRVCNLDQYQYGIPVVVYNERQYNADFMPEKFTDFLAWVERLRFLIPESHRSG